VLNRWLQEHYFTWYQGSNIYRYKALPALLFFCRLDKAHWHVEIISLWPGLWLPVAQQVFRPWLHKLWNLHWHIAWANARKIAVQQRHSDVCAKSRVLTKPQLTGTNGDSTSRLFKRRTDHGVQQSTSLTARAKQWFCGHMFMRRCGAENLTKYVCWRCVGGGQVCCTDLHLSST